MSTKIKGAEYPLSKIFSSDFDYEIQIAQTNRVEAPEIETVFMSTSLKYSYLSSTIVKEFASYGADISAFVPEALIDTIIERAKDYRK